MKISFAFHKASKNQHDLASFYEEISNMVFKEFDNFSDQFPDQFPAKSACKEAARTWFFFVFI
jgi:hypothetical protein